MKTKLVEFLTRSWQMLSEVPGWPDAPLPIRLRRVAPILVAVAAMLALLAWERGWRDPGMHRLRASHSPLLGLDEEINQLRLVCSDQQAVEMAGQAEQATSLLLDSPDDVAGLLRDLRDQIRTRGWEAVFQAYDAVAEAPVATGEVQFLVARARLVPVDGNPAAFQSVLGVFDQISAGNKRIDLTRLGVRADEPGKLEVELSLRIACRVPHEKAS